MSRTAQLSCLCSVCCTCCCRADGLGAEVKRRILMGTYALSAGYYDAYYKRAQQVGYRSDRRLSEAAAYSFCVFRFSDAQHSVWGSDYSCDILQDIYTGWCHVPQPLGFVLSQQ
jgi:hypothetical protein